MRKLSLIVLALVLAGCAQMTPNTDEMSNMDDMKDMENHMGCQEDEIDENGECITAEDNNRMLFDQEFGDEIVSMDVVEDGFQGYMAAANVEEELPLVVMIHEWWGLNDNIEYMADLLANEGYRVFAIDLYDGEVAEESSQAGELAGSVRSNPEEAVTKMQSAIDWVESEYGYTRVASMGWCFGGQQSLNLSLASDLDATVIYYGNLVTSTEELESISGPVLGIFGAEDGGIPVEEVRAFESSLDELGVENDINIYDGVGHAFANPSGSNYAAEETLDAWEKTTEFLSENLK